MTFTILKKKMWRICKKNLKNILMEQWKFWQNVNKWWKSEFIEKSVIILKN